MKPLPTHPALNTFFQEQLTYNGQLVCNENNWQAMREAEQAEEEATQMQSSFERLTEILDLNH